MNASETYEVPEYDLFPGAVLKPLPGTWYMVDVVNNLVYSPQVKDRPMRIHRKGGACPMVDVLFGYKISAPLYKVVWCAKNGVRLEDVPNYQFSFRKGGTVQTLSDTRRGQAGKTYATLNGDPTPAGYRQCLNFLQIVTRALKRRGDSEWQLYGLLKEIGDSLKPYALKICRTKDEATLIIEESVCRLTDDILLGRRLVTNPYRSMRSIVRRLCMERTARQYRPDGEAGERYVYRNSINNQ